MYKTFTFFLILFTSFTLQAQENCNHPYLVTVCPPVYLANQTNAGMGDDAPANFNRPGEDVAYKIFAPQGALSIFVSIVNASSSFKIFFQRDSCNTLQYATASLASGNSNITFSSALFYDCYIWIEAPVTITYDISFGGKTSTTLVSQPNTQGNLHLDGSCADHPFAPNKSIFEVTYNDTFQANPMTLAPLFQGGRMCITTYLTNNSGVEGARIFDFLFDTAGFSSVVPASLSFNGLYNAGTWTASLSGLHWIFRFTDAAGIGKGDVAGASDTCRAYSFCFDLTPLSNDPAKTDVDVKITSDGFGAAFYGNRNFGCCPSPFNNCLGGWGGYPGNNTHTFAFGFADPPALPVQLLSFTAEPDQNQVLLKWTTATEINNDFFTLEKSPDMYSWEFLAHVKGSGNSSNPVEYEQFDKNPFNGTSYYRLKQTDYDGASAIAGICAVQYHSRVVMVFPNPVQNEVHVETEINNAFVQILNAAGMPVLTHTAPQGGKIRLDVTDLSEGMYFMVISSNNETFREKILIVR